MRWHSIRDAIKTNFACETFEIYKNLDKVEAGLDIILIVDKTHKIVKKYFDTIKTKIG
jgi:hypothetical protein